MYVNRCWQLTLAAAWMILIGRVAPTSAAEGTTAASRTLVSLRQAQTFTVGDFNNDGFQDIVIADFLSDSLLVVLGEGGGRFRPAVSVPIGRGPRSVVSRDLDADGVTDLAAASFLSGDVSILLGKGDGTFREAHRATVGPGLASIAVDDFDGDGFVDVVGTNVLSSEIVLLKGTGRGTFEAAVQLARVKDVSVVVSGDADADGHADIVAVTLSGREARILYALSPGQFSVPINKDAAAVASWALQNLDPSVAAAGGAPSRRLRKIAGDAQTAHPTVPFKEPLKLEIIDADGRPRSGEEVSFSRLLGVGLMDEGERTRLTDDNGRAAVELATAGLPESHFVVGALNSQELAVFGATSILEPEEFGAAIETALLRESRNPVVAMESRALIDEAIQKLNEDDGVAAVRDLYRGMALLSPNASEVMTSVDMMKRWINQVLTVGSSVTVESAAPITCDVPVTDMIATAPEVDTFTFGVATAPQKVHISLAVEAVTAGFFTPGWRLLNPAGDPVVCEGMVGFVAGELDCRLGAPGSYTVEVMDIGVNGTGTYSLHLQRLNAAAPRCGGTMTCDVAISPAALDRRADTDIYSFAVSTANQKVHLSLAIETGTTFFTPGWRLLDPAGDSVTCEAISDFAGGERDCGPLAIGSYAVEVMDTGLNGTGTYSVHLQRLNATAPRCGGTLTCDVPMSGLPATLDRRADTDIYSFAVSTANQKVHISLAIESGTTFFTPGWRLLDPAGDSVTCEAISDFAGGERDCGPLAIGSYAVEVMDTGLNATGTYSLHLQRLNAAAPRCGGGTLSCDVPLGAPTATIDRRADTDIYSFDVSTANQKVHISLAIETGTTFFTPGWRLLDPAGDSVTCEAISDFAGGERDCGPLATGSYAVEIMDTGLNGTGTYSVHLQRLNAAAPRCGGTLPCDVPIAGLPATLDRRGDTDIYSFAVSTANQKVHISLATETAITPFFTPGWRLLNPAGDPVTCERISDFRAGERDCGPLAIGSYAVEVMDTGLDSTGTYSLHLQRLNAAAPRCGGTLTCDVAMSGTPATLDRRGDTDIYSFAVSTANQKVHISLATESAITPFFTPGWRLLNPAGDPVTCERITDFRAGERDCGPLAIGSYAVEVMDTGLDSSGTYSLHLQRLNAAAPRCGGTLPCDVPLGGLPATLDRRADTDIYSFAVSTADQKVHISLATESAISPFFTPGWRLLNAAGDVVTCERITDFRAGERDCGPLAIGSYAVEVMDTGLDSAGTYSLHLQRLNTSARCGGVIPCGAPTSGTIEARADTDLYAFNTSLGGTVSVNVVAVTFSGGSFNPGWRVVNPAGDAVVCGTSADFVSGTVSCANLAGGRHAVEVMDLGLNGTGTYRVTVSGSGCLPSTSLLTMGLEKTAVGLSAMVSDRFRTDLMMGEPAITKRRVESDAWRILSRGFVGGVVLTQSRLRITNGGVRVAPVD